jgi:hypothetical protein
MFNIFIALSLLLLLTSRCDSQASTASVPGVVSVTYTNNGTHTQFVATSSLDSNTDLANCYLAVGFNTIKKMVNTNE